MVLVHLSSPLRAGKGDTSPALERLERLSADSYKFGGLGTWPDGSLAPKLRFGGSSLRQVGLSTFVLVVFGPLKS